ncbi:MAG: hypothetical protein WAW96_15620, partial [Alphaproteobacteria bacterium]
MKAARLVVALTFTGIAALAACSKPSATKQGEQTAQVPAQSAADTKITLRRGNGAEPDTLDPARSSTVWENQIISDLNEGLMTVDPDGNPIYGAAI